MRILRAFWDWLGDVWDWFAARRWYVRVLIVLVVLIAVSFIGDYITNIYAFWDDAPDRGAVVVADDTFGDVANKIVYLDGSQYTDPKDGQGWAPKDSLWFDNITQGSDLIPYDFFLAIAQPNGTPFFSNPNMNDRYRYLARHPTANNPDGLPIGIVKDNYLGRNFMGFSCSACHTAQINYRGTGMRIDGAPAMADMDLFLTDLAADTRAAQSNPAVHARFVQKVLSLNDDYKTQAQVEADLKKYAMRLSVYNIVNRSHTHYGYARLDAFGRIYNQVLQYVVTVGDLKSALQKLVAAGRVKEADLDKAGVTAILAKLGSKSVLDGNDRDHIMARIAMLNIKQALYIRDAVFNAPDAPVSYPFLWDIPQHDYVQWNGIAQNAGLGPIGRNTGEVIGVFGTMNWSRSDHWTLEGVFAGQGMLNTHPVNFSSSVNVHNLGLIEDHLKNLHSPVWPTKILGPINYTDASKPLWQRGKIVFDRVCSACHAQIDRTASDRRVVAHMSAQDAIGTDPVMAVNSVGYQGYSGILRNQYVTVGPGNVLLDKRAPVAALLTKATTAVVATPDADKWWPRRFIEWAYDLIFSLRSNDIQPSMKNGDYHPDTTQSPLASLVAYKGRSLNGIWATAPYLHNGSVPTLYDMLLPAEPMAGDPPGMKYRPSEFLTGSREFDPVDVGFKSAGYNGFKYIVYTTASGGQKIYVPGNSNAGHEYGTRDRTLPDGTVQKALTEAERRDLLEYLKSL